MSLLLTIDGPKGTGKSTITEKLSKELNATLVKFDSDNVIETKDFNVASNEDVIHERGILSYQIYDWLWDNDLSLTSQDAFSRRYVNLKVPMQKRHYDEYMSKLDGKFIILYASDVNVLIKRINKRNAEIGKGANQQEWDSLVNSNVWFEAMGKVLKQMYPDKVIVIDILDYSTKESIYNYVKSVIGK